MLGKIEVLALQSPQIIINELAAEFQQRTGYGITRLLSPTDLPVRVRQRIDAGHSFDAAFLETRFLDQLVHEGKVRPDTRANFLRVPIGVAVRVGSTKPDVSSVEAFKRTILDARSSAYLKAGVSGPYLQGLFERWGIAEQVHAKSMRPDTDTVADLVDGGQAELGVTAIATLMASPGVEIVGPLPSEIQSYVLFAGAVGTQAAQPDGAGR